MKVVVESLTGTLFYVHVKNDATVADLKKEIENHQKIPCDRLILLLDTDRCPLMNHNDDDEEERVSLNDCGVHDGSHIYLFFNPVDDESNGNYHFCFTLPDVLLS
ncbi:uncharacterized protein LOC114762976 [Neltuma alba]|uniref:uncharacterized protein LOC114751703 n=1 Tax=Neltuma alba TaxID=207710 RepID=UPI0010A3A9C5|nr:uncharacterized protein LOC114751703 [Prosopis alba]XP_028808407.1 uncharacterized protein LOC114762976 [Prosopis alba]